MITHDLGQPTTDDVGTGTCASGCVREKDSPVGVRDQDRVAELVDQRGQPIALRLRRGVLDGDRGRGATERGGEPLDLDRAANVERCVLRFGSLGQKLDRARDRALDHPRGEDRRGGGEDSRSE